MKTRLFRILAWQQDEFCTSDTWPLVRAIVKKACSCAVHYVSGCALNQEELEELVPIILDQWMALNVGAANVVASIFYGNRTLSERIEQEIVTQFCQNLLDNLDEDGPGYLPHQLQFLETIVVADGHPIPANKVKILDVLQKSEFAPIVDLMDMDDERERLLDSVRNFKSHGQLKKKNAFHRWLKKNFPKKNFG